MMAEPREFHPATELFPLLTGKAFEDLVADIRRNGLREPILCDAEGRILDGRNRYRACRKAAVEPRYETWQGTGSEAELSLSLNLHRRHLDESQRALVGARLARLLREQREVSKFAHGKPLKPREQAAAMVNISPRLVIHALKVVDQGCAELVKAVEAGAVAVSTASLLAGLPQEEQARIVTEGGRAIAAKARALRGCAHRRPAGRFGLVRVQGLKGVLLWVSTDGLAAAIRALQGRGLQYLGTRASELVPEQPISPQSPQSPPSNP